MKKLFLTFCHRLLGMLATLVSIALLGACDSILDLPEEDCSVQYQVKFRYDYNMKYADAFPREVGSVTLYVFDEQGRWVYQKTEEGERLKEEGYAMTIDILPGDYRLMAWAGLNDDDSFSVPLMMEGQSKLEDMYCRMDRRSATRAGGGIIDGELSSLWHGMVEKCSFTARGGAETRAGFTQTVTVPLVKNTNRLRIILQQMNGVRMDVDHFEFTITDDNGLMNHDNRLLADEMLTYYPYFKTSGSTDMEGNTRATRADGSAATGDDDISVAIAEITTGRLMADKNPRLTVTNRETGEEVLRIPLVKYLLLTEAEGHKMTAQEYLDRQDEYNMTFFLDEDLKWINTRIVINDWVVRFNDFEDL